MATQAIDGSNCAPVANGVGASMNKMCQVRDCPCEATHTLQTRNYLDGTRVCSNHFNRHDKIVACMDADKKELDTFKAGEESPAPSPEGRYEVILDFGTPSSEKVATMEEVRRILAEGWEMSKADPEVHPHVQIFDGEKDITESQGIEEMIEEIMESSPEEERPMPVPDTTKCSGCGKPLCPSCGYNLEERRLCNACFELDPR